MIKGIIFDLDGTTLNTLYDLQDAINMTLKDLGLQEKSYDEVRMAIGKGARNLVADCLPQGSSKQEIDEAHKKFVEIYGKNYMVRTIPYEGIYETMLEIQKRNIKISANSNKPDLLTKNLLHKHFTEINFVDIIGQSDKYPIKPDPTGANILLQEMNLRSDEVLYIGDSETDYKTAVNANIEFIGCAYGFRGRKALEELGVKNIIETPKELLNYIPGNI